MPSIQKAGFWCLMSLYFCLFLSLTHSRAPTHTFQQTVFLPILPVNRLNSTQTEFLSEKNIHTVIHIDAYLAFYPIMIKRHVGPYSKYLRRWNLGNKTKNESVNIMVKIDWLCYNPSKANREEQSKVEGRAGEFFGITFRVEKRENPE